MMERDVSWRSLILVLVTALAAHGYALRPELAGTTGMWLGLLIPYSALAALALVTMQRDGTLRERLTPRWGDLSLGAIVAMLLLLGSWVARSVLTPPASDRHAWLLRVYLQLGPSETIQRSVLFTSMVVAIAAMEELVWRGLVLDTLTKKLGSRRAWPACALLYACATLPTIFTLRDASAGLNPLLPIAALGCGIFWSFMASVGGRLAPVMISHAVFSYFTAVQFRLPGF